MWKVQSMGTGNGSEQLLGPDEGEAAVKRNSTCDRPMVATMTMTRGRLNRRRSTSSDNAPDRGRQRDGGDERDPVVDPEVVVELDQEDGRHHAQLALGEVDHPAGAVDEHQAHRQQPVVEAEDGTLEDDRRRDRHPDHVVAPSLPSPSPSPSPSVVGPLRSSG